MDNNNIKEVFMKNSILICLLALSGTYISASETEAPEDCPSQLRTAHYMIAACAVPATHYLVNELIPRAKKAALLHAVRYNHLYAARLLLGLGTDPNEEQDDIGFPLHHAVTNGDSSMIHLLLSYGAIDQPNSKRQTALHLTQDPLCVDCQNKGNSHKGPHLYRYKPLIRHLLLESHERGTLVVSHPYDKLYFFLSGNPDVFYGEKRDFHVENPLTDFVFPTLEWSN